MDGFANSIEVKPVPYRALRHSLKAALDHVTNTQCALCVTRERGKNAVLVDLDTFLMLFSPTMSEEELAEVHRELGTIRRAQKNDAGVGELAYYLENGISHHLIMLDGDEEIGDSHDG